jgi:ribose/xylose/arabinose/galactoside ABC-type transport system permease subunit
VQRILVNIVGLLALVIYVQARTGLFMTTRNLENLSVEIVVITVCACAMTLVMVAGAIDVSVPGVVALSGVIAALLNAHGMPLWASFAIATACGAGVGLINSTLVLVVGVTSLIATIGTLYVSEGVGELITNGNTVAGTSENFSTLGNGFTAGIPNAVPIIVATVAVFVGIQRWTVLGRHVVAAGSNQQGAYLNGVSVKRVIATCFVLSGAAAGFGGVIYASRVGTAVPQIDNDLLFQVIVACVVGGTSLFGGEGSVFGTFVACVLIGAVNNSLDILGVSTFWQDIALGILLVAAVGLDVGLRQDGVMRLRARLLRRVPSGDLPHNNGAAGTFVLQEEAVPVLQAEEVD